mgnify:CR=1 FL=1
MKKYEPFKAKCINTVFMDDTEIVAFADGETYDSCFPEVWPDTSQKVALIDKNKDEHFMDWNWFHEHFIKL